MARVSRTAVLVYGGHRTDHSDARADGHAQPLSKGQSCALGRGIVCVGCGGAAQRVGGRQQKVDRGEGVEVGCSNSDMAYLMIISVLHYHYYESCIIMITTG